MSETLTVNRTAAMAAYQAADASAKKLLEGIFGIDSLKASITERITSLRDACSETGRNYDDVFSQQRVIQMSPLVRSITEWEILAEALNEGWEPDYSNTSEQKWYPWFKYKNGASGRGLSFGDYDYVHVAADVAPRLVFKSQELLKHAMSISPETFEKHFNQ